MLHFIPNKFCSIATPDRIGVVIDNIQIQSNFHSKGTKPFLIKDGICTFGKEATVHPRMNVKNYRKDSNIISGRLYLNYHIITLWNFKPTYDCGSYDYASISLLCSVVSKLRKVFPDVDNSWYIAFDRPKVTCITISEFIGKDDVFEYPVTDSGFYERDFWRHYEIIG